MTTLHPSTEPSLPKPIKSCSVAVKDLQYHYLDCPPPDGATDAPLLVLLHGFPELAFSWRSIMVPLSKLGYRVVAPDQRGYGQTASNIPKISYDDDPTPFSTLNLVDDVVSFIRALGYESAHTVVGHDAGSIIAGFGAWLHPDIFESVVMMSAPFTSQMPGSPLNAARVNQWLGYLAALDEPKKYYMQYFCSSSANDDMIPVGDQSSNELKEFLRNYFYVKSADWPLNDPTPLSDYTSLLKSIPAYYVMPLHSTMPQAVADIARGHTINISSWMSEEDIAFYTGQFEGVSFQGGLNWYRMFFAPNEKLEELDRACDKVRDQRGDKFKVPARFISGAKDWGIHQSPGALEKMASLLTGVQVGSQSENIVLIEGAGHWVQQESPEEVVQHLARFLLQCKERKTNM